jgi:glycosyltransferase involved in cell wall biosynthesis
MKVGAVLPHTLLYGGVKRFFELGTALSRLGHAMSVFTPEGAPPDWGDFPVEVRPLRDLDRAALDVLFFTERAYLDTVLQSRATYRVFYHVRQSDRVRAVVRRSDIHVFACSRNIQRHDRLWYGVTPFLAAGGIDGARYRPRPPEPKRNGDSFVVMAYGRLAERRKGTRLVVAACERLLPAHPNLRLLLFDTPLNPEMWRQARSFTTQVPFDFVLGHPVERTAELFQRADVFVSAEKSAGWVNTVAEAMACGVPVIATRSGTLDMVLPDETGLRVRRSATSIARALSRLMAAPDDFREALALNGRRHIEQFDWRRLAERIVLWFEEQERSCGGLAAGASQGAPR